MNIIKTFNSGELKISNNSQTQLAPGARVVIRDAEWLVQRVDAASLKSYALSCVGLSEIVRGKEAIFLTDLEKDIEVLRPEDTRLIPDKSQRYSDSLVYLESLLRQSPPTDERIYIGNRGAMDVVPYQLDPAIQALREPRQRILISDAVGLGKTIECGILLSELMRRGRGKRILVLAIKSMLTQFQKEMWARFTIPLVRLDSVGIQRIRSRIPSNHNPFYYYDKAIISIDTLKQEAEYRTYIEDSYWDIIVIDEAQNVADRGSGSLRARLAKLLSSHSDTLVMLSATPHDGKKRSFASLMNMLNPTAITNPDEYGPEDIRGLFIRRFKKDIKDQVAGSFREREIFRSYAQASPAEEFAFDFLSELSFGRIDRHKGGAMLFRTTLEKALFSSPAACIETIDNRIKTLEKKEESEYREDISKLEELKQLLTRITPDAYSKYQKLVEMIRDSGWTGKKSSDRLVIFTERIQTLKFLEEHLPVDLGLKEKQVTTLYGTLSDVDQQEVVERFGRESDSLRLLLASDVASEGINLHYLCHRLVHFDIPWSLMVFQQRNGRIDRYGQTETPLITYLLTESENDRIKGDLRILELLTEKDEQVVKNIGDPSEFTGIYDQEEEEIHTAGAMEKEQTPEEFEQAFGKKEIDPLAILMGELDMPYGRDSESSTASMPSLFESDFDYLSSGLNFIRRQQELQFEVDEKKQAVILTVPGELERRLRYLPPEIEVHDGQLVLTADRERVQEEIARCRKEDRMWPELHLLWEQHPVAGWVNDKVIAAFRRHEAPVLTVTGILRKGESVFIVSGLVPNRKSHPLIHRWFGISFRNGEFYESLELDEVIRMTGIGKKEIPQPLGKDENPDLSALASLLPLAVEKGREIMSEARRKWEEQNNPRLQEHLERLDDLRGRRHRQLELDFGEGSTRLQLSLKASREREINKLFDEYQEWIKETMTTEDKPYLRIAAVLWGGDRDAS